MFKSRWFSAMATLLIACSCAAATPLGSATDSIISGQSGGHDYRDFTYSPCPADVRDTSITSLTGGAGNLTDCVSTAMNWSAEGWGTQWVNWSNEMPGPLVTIDFGSTVRMNSMIVWGDDPAGSGDISVPYRVSVAGTNFTIPADPNWNPQAYTFSELDLISNSVGLQFSQVPGNWDLAGEVSFGGPAGSSLLRPSTGLLVPGVLIAIGLLGRKRMN
jgi:hypothetical protein